MSDWQTDRTTNDTAHGVECLTDADIRQGPATTEARAIAHEFAKVRELKAKELMDKAQAHYRACCDHWEACCADTFATAPEN